MHVLSSVSIAASATKQSLFKNMHVKVTTLETNKTNIQSEITSKLASAF